MVYRLSLSVDEPGVLLDHDELQLLFSSAPAAPGPGTCGAARPDRGSACSRRGSAGDLGDGQPVAFRRRGPCSVGPAKARRST